jgi:acyl-coenzyme A synthetase/AMP-(fatty) acid ligase
MSVLAYVPFITPMAWVYTWWYLLILPLAFGIAVIYKALRLADLSHFWRQVMVMTAQIVLGMVGLAAALVLLVLVVIPLLPVG